MESGWFTDCKTNHLFVYCILRANFQDKEWNGITLKRGQFATSYATLSRETGLTVQQVRTSLSKLKSTSNITSTSTNKYQVITITNYDKYQDSNKLTNKQTTNKQQTNNKQITTDNKTNTTNNIIGDTKKGTRWQRIEPMPSDFWEYPHNSLGWSDFDINEEYEKFSDYWTAVAGAKGVKRDWLATWRNWCRNSRRSTNNGNGTSNTKTARDAILDGLGLR